MNKNNVDAANKISLELEEICKYNTDLRQFYKKIIDVIKNISDDYVKAEKENIFNKSYISHLEKRLKPLLAKEAIIKMCFGDDIKSFLDFAAENLIRRYNLK